MLEEVKAAVQLPLEHCITIRRRNITSELGKQTTVATVYMNKRVLPTQGLGWEILNVLELNIRLDTKSRKIGTHQVTRFTCDIIDWTAVGLVSQEYQQCIY